MHWSTRMNAPLPATGAGFRAAGQACCRRRRRGPARGGMSPRRTAREARPLPFPRSASTAPPLPARRPPGQGRALPVRDRRRQTASQARSPRDSASPARPRADDEHRAVGGHAFAQKDADHLEQTAMSRSKGGRTLFDVASDPLGIDEVGGERAHGAGIGRRQSPRQSHVYRPRRASRSKDPRCKRVGGDPNPRRNKALTTVNSALGPYPIGGLRQKPPWAFPETRDARGGRWSQSREKSSHFPARATESGVEGADVPSPSRCGYPYDRRNARADPLLR